MGTKDLADLLIAATGRIDFYWNFYTITVLALIGWMVSTEKPLAVRLKILITVGYILFAIMTLGALKTSYYFADAIRQDLLISVDKEPMKLKNLLIVLDNKQFTKNIPKAVVMHTFLGACVLYAVWFARLGKPPGPKSEP